MSLARGWSHSTSDYGKVAQVNMLKITTDNQLQLNNFITFYVLKQIGKLSYHYKDFVLFLLFIKKEHQ